MMTHDTIPSHSHSLARTAFRPRVHLSCWHVRAPEEAERNAWLSTAAILLTGVRQGCRRAPLCRGVQSNLR